MSDQAISLEAYALVRAGIDFGLPLRRALENARVLPRDWGPCAVHWEDALDERNADPELAMEYELALLKATERFEPVAQPIASDPLAWGTFRRHVIASTDPAAFLAKRGVDLAMFGRLEGIWSDRSDEPVVVQALQEAESGPLGPCPRVEIVMSLLADRGVAPARRAKAEAAKDPGAGAKPDVLGQPKAVPAAEAIDELPTFMRPEHRLAPLPEPSIPVSSPTAPLPISPLQASPPAAHRTSPLNATAIASPTPVGQTTPFAPAPTASPLSRTAPMEPLDDMEPAPRTSRIPTVSSGTIAVDPRMVEEALRPLPFDGKGR